VISPSGSAKLTGGVRVDKVTIAGELKAMS
jgi:hypothetical protein